MATEGLGHRRDQTDFARCAIGEAIFAGGLAALMGNLFERPAGVDALVDLRGGHDQAACPVAGGIERHEIDETPDDARFSGGGGKSLGLLGLGGAEPDGNSFWPPPAPGPE